MEPNNSNNFNLTLKETRFILYSLNKTKHFLNVRINYLKQKKINPETPIPDYVAANELNELFPSTLMSDDLYSDIDHNISHIKRDTLEIDILQRKIDLLKGQCKMDVLQKKIETLEKEI